MKNVYLLLALVSLIFLSCSGIEGYPQSVRDNFINACGKQDSAKTLICQCVMGKIETKYTYKEYAALEADIQAGRPTSDFDAFMNAAVAECKQ